MNDADLTITYNGAALDPSDEIVRTADVPLVFFDEGGSEYHAQLRIVTWRSGTHRAVYYGQDGGHFLYEESAKDVEPRYRYARTIATRAALRLRGSKKQTGQGAISTMAGP